jgi:hypothetical protein
MRTGTTRRRPVTRRMYERRLDEVFGTRQGGRVMQHARAAGLVATVRQGRGQERPLQVMERASLILISALCAGTSLTLAEATGLVVAHAGWRRAVLVADATGEGLLLRHRHGPALTMMLVIPNAVIRDPVLGVGGAWAVAA